MDADTRNTALGFLGAAVVLGALLWLVGAGEVVAALSVVTPVDAAMIGAVGLCWLFAWGMALRTVLGALGVRVDPGTSFLLYASAAFANHVTPFGQAGGEPFAALLIAGATDDDYETGLAAIASVDALNFAPSIALALVGLTYYIAAFTVDGRFYVVLAGVVGLAVAVPAVGYVVWRTRARIREWLVATLVPLIDRLPRLPTPSPEAFRERIESFYRSLGRVATDRRSLAVALAFSTAGWLLLATTLYLSLVALGFDDPTLVAVSLVAIPIGGLASVTPLPGGLGGIEFAIVLIVVPMTAISAEGATAAALVYQAATYWLSTAVGGLAVVYLRARG